MPGRDVEGAVAKACIAGGTSKPLGAEGAHVNELIPLQHLDDPFKAMAEPVRRRGHQRLSRDCGWR
jgi:hypothetical protein